MINNNDGTVALLDPTKADGAQGQYATIASGGTRGDFASADTSNGTLFLSETNAVYRLSCSGCSIGSEPSSTPEPASLSLFGSGLMAVGWMLRRRRK